ncbi:MAG: hypothetical protein COB66_07325, partial [Coxiella sp. (in: Bacteria)]
SADIGYNHDFIDHLGLGFEIDAGFFGKAKYTFTNGNSKVDSWVVSYLAQILGHYDPVDAILKMGYGRVHTSITDLNRQRITATHFEVGAGIAYNFGKHYALQVLYIHMFGENLKSITLSDTPKINSVLVGIKIMF